MLARLDWMLVVDDGGTYEIHDNIELIARKEVSVIVLFDWNRLLIGAWELDLF